MSRKHFKMLADNLRAERPGENWDANKLVQWNLCVKAVAKTCKWANSGFKFERFYTACGELFHKDGYIL